MGDIILNLEALKAQFSFHLESLENLDTESFSSMTAFLLELGDKIQLLVNKPDKTEEEKSHIEQLIKEISKFIGQLSEAQLLLRKKECRNIQAEYEKLKQEAKSGDSEALKAFKEFEPVYQSMLETMNEDTAIDFPSSSSLKFLTSHLKS